MTDTSSISPPSHVSPAATRLRWLTPVALVAALFAMSWWAYDRMPATIEQQTLFSGRHGHPQSAAQVAFTVPVFAAICVLGHLLAAQWNVLVRPRRALSSRDAAAMWPLAIRMLTITTAQFIIVHAVTLAVALGRISEIAGLRGQGIVMSLAVVVIGNSMPLVTRRNHFVGYRMWGLHEDPDGWRHLQRTAGYCCVAAGLLLAATFVVAPLFGKRLLLPILVVTLLAPVLLTRRAAQRDSV